MIEQAHPKLVLTGTSLLPRKVHVRLGECASSILWRLATANGYPSIARMVKATPEMPELRNCLTYRQTLVELAAHLSHSPLELVDKFTPVHSGAFQIIRQHRFRVAGPKTNTGRVCPLCLIEDDGLSGPEALRPYRRDWWGLRFLNGCPIHSCEFVSDCPRCSKPLKVNGSPTSCPCNPHFDIRNHEATPISDSDLEHDRWLLGRMGVTEPTPNAFLDKMSADSATSLCQVVGIAAEATKFLPGSTGIYALEKASTRSEGYRILSNWPANFENFLDRKFDEMSKLLTTGPVTAYYGGLCALLRKKRTPDFDPVENAIRRHIAQGPRYNQTAFAFGKSVNPDDKIFRTNIRPMTGTSYKGAISILESTNFMKHRAKNGQNHFSMAEVKHIQNVLGRTVPIHHVQDTLEFTRDEIIHLIDADILDVEVPSFKAFSGLISQRSFDNLVLALADCPSKTDEAIDDLISPMDPRLRFLCKRGVVIEHIVKRRLAIHSRVGEGLGISTIRFRLSDLFRAIYAAGPDLPPRLQTKGPAGASAGSSS